MLEFKYRKSRSLKNNEQKLHPTLLYHTLSLSLI